MINGSGQMVCDGPYCKETAPLTFDQPVGWLTTRYDYKNWADFCGVACAGDFTSRRLISAERELEPQPHHNID